MRRASPTSTGDSARRPATVATKRYGSSGASTPQRLRYLSSCRVSMRETPVMGRRKVRRNSGGRSRHQAALAALGADFVLPDEPAGTRDPSRGAVPRRRVDPDGVAQAPFAEGAASVSEQECRNLVPRDHRFIGGHLLPDGWSASGRWRRHRRRRSEEHTSELQSRENLVCRLLLEKKKRNTAAGKL